MINFSKNQVDHAGYILANPGILSNPVPGVLDSLSDWSQYDDALTLINNWRALHSFPLNTFQKYLRKKAKIIDNQSLVAQRIKRLSSIELKLARFSKMKLSRMQDIGGCRAVVASVEKVYELVNLYERSDIKHKVVRKDNYIENPKTSGYRGVHIIYDYFSDKRQVYNGLKIEMQFRSQLQHAWATSVETVGTFVRQSLKSSQGEEDWLRFFALMSTAIAFREGSTPVPNTPTNPKTLRAELRQYSKKLDVINRLHTFGQALKTLEPTNSSRKAHYFLLILDPAANSITVTGYKYHELGQASKDYLESEKLSKLRSTDVVLVSVESMDSLRRAYPNYFLDTNVFISAVKEAIA